jgi:hypothetical protein
MGSADASVETAATMQSAKSTNMGLTIGLLMVEIKT